LSENSETEPLQCFRLIMCFDLQLSGIDLQKGMERVGNTTKENSTVFCWLHGPVVEHWSLAGVLLLSCARPVGCS